MAISCIDNDNVHSQDSIIQSLQYPNEIHLKPNEVNNAETDAMFDTFMHNSPLLAWVVDEDGYLRYTNPPYKQTFEHKDDVIGRNIFDLYPKKFAEEYTANNKKVIETNSPIIVIEQSELSYDVVTNKVIKFPVVYRGTKMVAAWAINISNQITAQESLIQLNHHKDKLISLMAHDIKGPLAVNLSFIDSILEEFDHLDKETIFKYLLMLKDSINKCYHLVDDMLAWGKDQLAQLNFNPKPFNIETEVFKVVDSLWDLISQKELDVNTRFNFSGEIFADVDMFIIVLRNLVSNAIKFSHPKSVISVETNSDSQKVFVKVKDVGVGMNKEQVAKILNKVNFESTPGTKGEKGTGLGLNLVKDYIEQNGGELIIESEEGRGSIFHFTLPLDRIS